MTTGWEGFKLKHKFKNLKENIKKWNKDAFENVFLKKVGTLEEMKHLDKLEVEGTISVDQTRRLADLKDEFEVC